ncbi:hypothetical protein [uncultured Porphyromonas sp.]|uniref:hypothetical protein n=1 Tax=uncultured Porphyromonas sp. TaxID=159274 RepID=UPI0026080F4D|nr:hypothetical protein [uncultured Porphyromonas sp.]
MARNIADIRRLMTEAFGANEDVVKAYGLTPGKTYDEQFSKVSIESLLFWSFSAGIAKLETIYDDHRKEVIDLIAASEPHTLFWYSNRAKSYLHGFSLKPYSDEFDTAGASDDDLARAHIVRYAVASEYQDTVYLKVAGVDETGAPVVLSESVLSGIRSYIAQIKDAGVAVRVISAPGDDLDLSLEIYMQPSLLLDSGLPSQDRQREIRKVVERNTTSLPFDGVFRPSDLVVALSRVAGVESSVVTSASSSASGEDDWKEFTGFHRPSSGYYKIRSLSIAYKPYEPFNSI